MRWWYGLTVVLLASVALAAGVSPDAARAQLTTDNPGVRMQFEDLRLTRVYGTPLSFGLTAEQSADRFVREHADVFGLTPDELVPGNTFNRRYTQPVMYDRQTGTYKFTLVYYTQYRDEIPVYRAELRLLVRNEDGHPLALAASSLRDLGDFHVAADAVANINEGAAHAAAIGLVPGLINFSESELVIWGGVENQRVEPTVALSFVADNGCPATGQFEKWLFVADARSGEILHRENMILNVDVVGNVSAWASPDYRADACVTEEVMPMPYARVSIGSTHAYADVNGDFVIPNAGSTPVNVNSKIRGRYFVVQNQAGVNSQLTLEVTPPGPVNFVHNESNSEYTTAEVNSYIQANNVRDMALAANPDYPVIKNQLEFQVNVNISDTCNAFYDGASINFFRAGGGCNNTGFGDVVHHEYGHHLVAVGGSGQGAYGEGMGDVSGLLITGRSMMAVGFENCYSGIRNADNDLQYPCGGEIHYCGQLISGCVWDTREELKITEPVEYNNIIRDLAINAILVHSGTSITPSITVDYLVLDDDDADITNGTPHYYEIADGFGAHNMDAPPLALLGFRYPDGRPDLLDPAGGTTFRVEVYAVGGQPQPDTGELHYDAGSGWQTVPMTAVAPNVYDAEFPAITCGASVKYYVSAKTTTNQTVTNPVDAPASTYSALSAYGLSVTFEDDFDTDKGWVVENSASLTDGPWERGIPIGGGQRGDPPTAFGGSGWCALTDNEAGNSDVDDGYTWWISPTIDLSEGDAQVTYALWYTNNFGNAPNSDLFKVDVSNDNGANWTTAHVHGPETSAGWTVHSFNVGDFVTPNATVKVRFEASDLGDGSVVEAGVDAFRVEIVDCAPPFQKGDLNCDSQVDFGDINPFVLALTNPDGYAAAFPDCNIMNADINEDGEVNFGDINPFVSLLTQP